MILRQRHQSRIEDLLTRFPVVAILGARQVGKATIAREIASRGGNPSAYFDLEDPEDLARLNDPKLALGEHRGLVVIDEVQLRPELFPTLRVLADRRGMPARFLVLGSASPGLLRQSSESLAGRIAYHELSGFSVGEVGISAADELWLRGGFPLSFTAASDEHSAEWRRQFVRTFLERDIPQMGVRIPAATLRRFWSMLAHYHAQVWNGAELARALGVAESTVRRYLDVLSGALVVRQLPPWHENLKKRQVKSPKIYIEDSGILHTLLGLAHPNELERHPKVGASWEGFVLQQLVHHLAAEPEECFFWATHAGAELDLLVVSGGRRMGFEIKHTSSPRTGRSMYSALNDLGLDTLDVIHAGENTCPLGERVRAVAFSRFSSDIEALRS